MSAGSNQRPEDGPLNVFLVESLDGIRVQIVVSVTGSKLARVRRDDLATDGAAEEKALTAAQRALHAHGKRVLDELRTDAYGAIDCYVEQLEVCDREFRESQQGGARA